MIKWEDDTRRVDGEFDTDVGRTSNERPILQDFEQRHISLSVERVPSPSLELRSSKKMSREKVEICCCGRGLGIRTDQDEMLNAGDNVERANKS
jgi:hypothetical protein